MVSVRKALGLFKKSLQPDVVVAEFNFQSDFRDRTSSLESLLAVVQRNPQTRVIVFYEKEYEHQFDKLRAAFPVARDAGLSHCAGDVGAIPAAAIIARCIGMTLDLDRTGNSGYCSISSVPWHRMISIDRATDPTPTSTIRHGVILR